MDTFYSQKLVVGTSSAARKDLSQLARVGPYREISPLLDDLLAARQACISVLACGLRLLNSPARWSLSPGSPAPASR